MNILVLLVPCSLILGLGALAAFVWTLRHNQYDDPAGDAARILLEDDMSLANRSTPAVANRRSAGRDGDSHADAAGPRSPHDV